MNKTRDFASRAVNLAKLFLILSRFGAPLRRRPQRSRGTRGIITPLEHPTVDQLTEEALIHDADLLANSNSEQPSQILNSPFTLDELGASEEREFVIV